MSGRCMILSMSVHMGMIECVCTGIGGGGRFECRLRECRGYDARSRRKIETKEW
jgi:hypothetical protein